MRKISKEEFKQRWDAAMKDPEGVYRLALMMGGNGAAHHETKGSVKSMSGTYEGNLCKRRHCIYLFDLGGDEYRCDAPGMNKRVMNDDEIETRAGCQYFTEAQKKSIVSVTGEMSAGVKAAIDMRKERETVKEAEPMGKLVPKAHKKAGRPKKEVEKSWKRNRDDMPKLTDTAAWDKLLHPYFEQGKSIVAICREINYYSQSVVRASKQRWVDKGGDGEASTKRIQKENALRSSAMKREKTDTEIWPLLEKGLGQREIARMTGREQETVRASWKRWDAAVGMFLPDRVKADAEPIELITYAHEPPPEPMKVSMIGPAPVAYSPAFSRNGKLTDLLNSISLLSLITEYNEVEQQALMMLARESMKKVEVA